MNLKLASLENNVWGFSVAGVAPLWWGRIFGWYWPQPAMCAQESESWEGQLNESSECQMEKL
jgi:hypothetical protein